MLRRAGTRVVVGGGGGGRRGGALMASLIHFLPSSAYSSSHLPPQPQPRPTPTPTPTPAPAAARRDPEPLPFPAEAPPDPAVEERRSLAVRTGELFLGLAALLLRGTGAVRGGGGGGGGGGEGRGGVGAAARGRGGRAAAAGAHQPRVQLLRGWAALPLPPRRRAVPHGQRLHHLIASRNTMQDALQVTKDLADNCRSKGTAFRLGAVLRDVLDKFLPDDLHIRCNGRIRVAITQLSWRPRGLLVDQFDSKEDVINAVITSSFIPGYLAPRPATYFHNRLCIDGGLTLFMPPTSASETVRICAFPANRLGLQGIGISPDCNPENRASPRQLFNWALEPAEDEILDKLYELGYMDAAVWVEQKSTELNAKNDQPLAVE